MKIRSTTTCMSLHGPLYTVSSPVGLKVQFEYGQTLVERSIFTKRTDDCRVDHTEYRDVLGRGGLDYFPNRNPTSSMTRSKHDATHAAARSHY